MKKSLLLGAVALATAWWAWAESTVTTTPVYTWPSAPEAPKNVVDDEAWTYKLVNGTVIWSLQSGTDYKTMGNSYTLAESWLVSPAFTTEAGKDYQITFEYKGTSASNYNLQVAFTTETPLNDVEAALAAPAQDVPLNASTTYLPGSVTFTADTDGKHYFAFHVSELNTVLVMRNINITEISTTETEQPEQPEEPGDHDCSGLAVPYYSPAACATGAAEGWTVINANNDNKAWTQNSNSSSPSGNGYDMKISYSAKNVPEDDYLIAPAVHMQAGKEYRVVYNWKCGSTNYPENLSVYLSESLEPEAIKASQIVKQHLSVKTTTYTKESVKITPEHTGDYHVAFYCHSDGDQMGMYVADLMVAENSFAPGSVSYLTVTPDANRELSCRVGWILPTVDCFGDAMPSDKPITEVRVYRDGAAEPTAVLEGEATEFTDDASYGLTSGKHTYAVSVVAGGIEGPKTVSALSSYVGPVAPASIPANFQFSDADDFGMWTTLHGEGAESSATWTYDSSQKSAKFVCSSNKATDDWLITPAIAVTEAGYYRVTFPAFSTGSYATNYEIYLTESTDVLNAELTPITLTWSLPQAYTSTNPTPESLFDFYVEQPGTYYIAVRNHKEGVQYNSSAHHFRGARITASAFVPGVVTDLQATPASDGSNNIHVSWSNPVKDFAGRDMSADQYKVALYLNDSAEAALTITDGSTEAVVPVAEAGVYTVTAKVLSTDGNDTCAPESPSVSTAWVGSRKLDMPYQTNFQPNDGTRLIWTPVNGNDDATAFYYYSTSSTGYFKIDGAYEYNDYLLSPEFELAPGFYQVAITHRGGSSTQTLKPILGLARAGSFDATDAASLLASQQLALSKGSYTDVNDSWTFKVTEAGTYQIIYGLNEVYGSKVYNNPELRAFSITTTSAYPADVTDLKAEISADDESAVVLSWTNPSKVFNTDIDLDAIEAMVIERDGQQVAVVTEGLVPGQEATFTDVEVPAGVHTYRVFATVDGLGHEGDYPTVTTAWVGGALTAPVDCVSDFPGWTTDDANGDGTPGNTDGLKQWYFKNTYYVIYGFNNNHDDYLISAPLNIEEGIVYKLTYSCAPTMDGLDKDLSVAVKMGTGDDHKEFATIGSIEMSRYVDRYTYVDYDVYVCVAKPEDQLPANSKQRVGEEGSDDANLYDQATKVDAGANRVALHFTQPGSFRVKEFHMAEAGRFDVQTGVSDILVAGMLFDGKTLSFEGTADVAVYDLAGVCVAKAAAVTGAYTLPALQPGYYMIALNNGSAKTILKVALR